jgi:signal transduction histidine kinase
MELTDPIARLSAGPVHFAHAGWAFVDISPESNPTSNDDYYLLYDHPYSFESNSWQNANKSGARPVCVMNAGYSSGWCEHSFGLPLVAVEILCRAKGDPTCRFIMAPPERIEGHVVAYRERHPELASSIVNYQIPGFFSKRTDRQLLRQNLELEQRAELRARELAAINARLELDIKERKRAQAALSASQELNERLIEALPGGVVHIARDGSVLRANAEGARVLGLDIDKLKGVCVADFGARTVFEDGSPAAIADFPVTRAIATGQAQGATTLGIQKPNGELSWAVFRAVPTRDVETSEITGAVVTFFDITERKRFEDKLRHAQKLESLGVLAGGIAHDFNNLLVTILGNASLGRSMAGSDPRIAPLFDEIELGARRAAELTKQMLDYAGRGRFKQETIKVPEIVQEMDRLLKAVIPKQVELYYELSSEVPPILADGAQIRQVVMNLVTNAAEAMADRPGRVRIALSERPYSETELEGFLGDASAGSFVRLEVRDNGIGMDEATRTRVFDPFFTTKFKGRGLGMAAVLGIIRSHHGGIHIESCEGAGTQAVVLLPVDGRAR